MKSKLVKWTPEQKQLRIKIERADSRVYFHRNELALAEGDARTLHSQLHDCYKQLLVLLQDEFDRTCTNQTEKEISFDQRVFKLLNDNWSFIENHEIFSKVITKKFTLKQVQLFLACKPGDFVMNSHFSKVTTSDRIRQAISVIGADGVDRNKVDDLSHATYKRVWKVEVAQECAYCKKLFYVSLMFRGSNYCSKPKCVHAAMRDQL